MKNKIVKIISVISFLSLMAFTFILNSNKIEKNDITLDNLVALNTAFANVENEGGMWCVTCTNHMAPVCFYVNGRPVPGFFVSAVPGLC